MIVLFLFDLVEKYKIPIRSHAMCVETYFSNLG